MTDALRVTDVHFASASPEAVETGLLGWVSLTLNGSLRLDGVAVRKTLDGRLALSFPSRRDGQGRRHAYVRPLDDRARRDIERQVLSALGFLEEAKS